MIHPSRIWYLKPSPYLSGPVVYWMQRDQRAEDNWALLYAQEMALKQNQPLAVVFCLVPSFLEASERHYRFMLAGLSEVEKKLTLLNIPFFLLQGDPENKIPGFVNELKAGLLVTDFNPLRLTMAWRHKVTEQIDACFAEVDAHNILPCRAISGKQEYSAFTFRKKVSAKLNEYLTEIPALKKMPDISIPFHISHFAFRNS
jgi:deoxyribodipyrimidine photo-lyase